MNKGTEVGRKLKHLGAKNQNALRHRGWKLNHVEIEII